MWLKEWSELTMTWEGIRRYGTIANDFLWRKNLPVRLAGLVAWFITTIIGGVCVGIVMLVILAISLFNVTQPPPAEEIIARVVDENGSSDYLITDEVSHAQLAEVVNVLQNKRFARLYFVIQHPQENVYYAAIIMTSAGEQKIYASPILATKEMTSIELGPCIISSILENGQGIEYINIERIRKESVDPLASPPVLVEETAQRISF